MNMEATMDPREVQRLINATTGVNRGRTRAIRTQRARTAARRVSRGGMGGTAFRSFVPLRRRRPLPTGFLFPFLGARIRSLPSTCA